MAPGIAGKGGVVLWSETLLNFVVVGLRLYTRRFVRGTIGADDWCLVATAFFLAMFAVFMSVGAVHGMGQHAKDLTTDQFSEAVLWLLCGQVVASMAIGMGKTTVAVFLLRIITAPWQRWFLWFCIGSMTFLSALLSIAVFAQCTPVESIWRSDLASEKVCHVSLTAVAFADCAYAAVLDFALAGFPWIALRNLNMKRKERITICTSLSLGIFAGICGVIRTSGLKALSNSADYLYATSDSVIWTFSEVTTTIVCVSLPALRPLFNKIVGNNSSSGGYQQHDDSALGTSGTYNLKSYPKREGDLGYNRKSTHRVTTNVEAGHSQTMRDNGSDESILLHESGQKTTGNNIMRVQEVNVTYEKATSENNSVSNAV